jgi:hypothetical protein
MIKKKTKIKQTKRERGSEEWNLRVLGATAKRARACICALMRQGNATEAPRHASPFRTVDVEPPPAVEVGRTEEGGS